MTVSTITINATLSVPCPVQLLPNQESVMELSLPVSCLRVLPSVALEIEEFPRLSMSLSPSLSSLHASLLCVTHHSLSQLRVAEKPRSHISMPLEEECIAGAVNEFEYGVEKEKDEVVVVRCDDELKECCVLEEKEGVVCLRVDLTNERWLLSSQEERCVSVVLKKEEFCEDNGLKEEKDLKLHIKQPFTFTTRVISNTHDESSDSTAVAVFGEYGFAIECSVHVLVSSVQFSPPTLLDTSSSPITAQLTAQPDASIFHEDQTALWRLRTRLPVGWNQPLRLNLGYTL